MKKQYKVQVLMIICMLIVLSAMALTSGCTQVIVDKPDGTRIKVNTFGTTKLKDMAYIRDGLSLVIGSGSSTPEGMDELVPDIMVVP